MLGNCQVDPIRHLIYQSTGIREIKSFNFNVLNDKSDQESLVREIKTFDLVVSQVFGREFGNFEKNEIRRLFPNVILIPNLFFLGWHQDMTYIGNSRSRIKGPTGEYHSLIALALAEFSFPKEKNQEMFDSTLAHFIGLHPTFRLSEASLKSKFEESDLDFDRFQSSGIFSSPFMWTMNHPNNRALFALLEQVFNLASISTELENDYTMMFAPNPLSMSVNWTPLQVDDKGVMKSIRRYYIGKGQFLSHQEFISQELEILRNNHVSLEMARRPDISHETRSELIEYIKINFNNIDYIG